MAEVVYFKAEADDTILEEADEVEEEYMMEVVENEADMTEAVGIIQVTDGEYRMQERYSAMMAHIKFTLTMKMSGPGYQRLIRAESEKIITLQEVPWK